MPMESGLGGGGGGGYAPPATNWWEEILSAYPPEEDETFSLPVSNLPITGNFTPPINDPYGGLGSTPYTPPAWGGLTTNTDQGDLNWPNWQNDETGFFEWLNEGGGGGGGGPFITPSAPATPAQSGIEWELGDYDVGGQGPDWWRPFKVKDDAHLSNPMVSSTLMMNALIGSGALSEEDARSMAKQLFTIWGAGNETQGAENPWDLYSAEFGEREDILGSPTMQGSFDPFISEQQQLLGQTGPGVIDENNIFSANRAQQSIGSLDAMSRALYGGNEHELGAGYEYLKQVAATLGEGGNDPSRAERLQVLGALDPMLAQSQGGELGAFSSMAQALASPFYTNLPPQYSQTQAGDYQFGSPSQHLFF